MIFLMIYLGCYKFCLVLKCVITYFTIINILSFDIFEKLFNPNGSYLLN